MTNEPKFEIAACLSSEVATMNGEQSPGGDVLNVMHGILPSNELHSGAEEYTKNHDSSMPRIARWASFQEDSLVSASNLLENEEYLEQQHESSTSNCNSTGFDDSSANTYDTTTNDSNEASAKLNGSISPEKTASNTGDFHLRVDHEMALPPLVVQAPVQYVASLPGKKVRDKAAKALNIWLKVGEHHLSQITDVVSLLHSASLVLDDVEDGSSCRRGKPSAHTIFGSAQAINSAGFQINRALLEVMKLDDPRCMAIFSEEMENLYVGQAYDLYWTFNGQRPTFKEYIAMVDHKTGALFNMLVRFMAAKSTAISEPNSDLFNLVILLGRFFQIRDDYMNLTSDDVRTPSHAHYLRDKNGTKKWWLTWKRQYTDQKGFCDDLDEGKFSLILIHALINSSPSDQSMMNHILAQRHKVDHMPLSHKRQMLDIIQATGSYEFTVAALREIGQEIQCILMRLENYFGVENHLLRALLDVLGI